MNRLTNFLLFTLSGVLLFTAGAPARLQAQSTEESRPPAPPELREPRVPIAWNRLYDYPEVVMQMRQLQREFPQLARLERIGTSVEGRDMLLLTIAAGPDRERPAMWVDGNVHGNEVQAAETCVYLAWYILENYGRVPAVTELLDRVSFYIMPMVNPDGRAWWFQAPNTSSSSRSGKRPTDNDGDGLLDEDGYDDLDGDGEILQMRKRDPHGRWKLSPDDPRMLVRAKPGEPGGWSRLGREGIDNDNDGRVNEDGPGGYDMNRNWPSLWMPNYVQFGAGEYPFSYPETRCIGDFIAARPQIAAVQSFHNTGGMVLRGPGAKSYGNYPGADVRIYDEMGKTGERLMPFYRYLVIWKDLYTVYGGFVTWTYEGLGIFSFTNELWSQKRLYSKDGAVTAEARMEFNDLLRSGLDFVDWKPAVHPTYGEIEIGGWRKATGRTPPSFLIEEELHRNALFCVYHATEMPELAFDEVKVTPRADGKTQLDVVITNRRAIPSISTLSREKKIGQPDLLEVTGSPRVLFSAVVERQFPEQLRAIEAEPQRILNRRGVGRDVPYRVRILVDGKGQLELVYRSDKARTLRRSVVIE